MPRTPALIVLALLAVALMPASGAAHAVLLSSEPPAEARLAASPPSVRLMFSEPVQLVSPEDADVVDERGELVIARDAAVAPGDAATLEIPLRDDLPGGTYTVRYRIIGADSHVIGGVVLFRVGPGELADPVLAGAATAAGPSETGAWGVSARFIELLMLGGLAGLLAFRWLVWRPAVRDAAGRVGDERAALVWGRDVFWIGFGVLALGAMLAEGYVLVVQSASVLGTGVADAAADVPGLSDVLSDTRFGTFLQVRAALLFVLFALGAWQFHREYGGSRGLREPSVAGRGLPTLALVAVLGVVLWQLSAQGHPSQAPLPVLQTGLHFVHLASVAVWIGGLALAGLALWRLPRVAPDGGRLLATGVLARFSQVALAVVAVAVVTGVARAVGQLSDPAQLWETGYGRSILVKLVLLCPIAVLALRNRRIVSSLRRLGRPNAAALVAVRRAAGAELVLALAIVMVASLLVAQVPGRV